MIIRLLLLITFVCVTAKFAVAQQTPASSILKPAVADGHNGFAALNCKGYTPLFNGKDLTGWTNPYPHGDATVVDGEIHLQGDNKFFLVTEKQYADFRVSVEILLPEGEANSGVMFRCHVDPDKEKIVYGYQAECDGSDRRWSGGLFDEARRRWIWPSTTGRSEKKFLKHEATSKLAFEQPAIRDALNRNGWNRFVITCIQDRIMIELNGVRTVTFRDAADAAGHIGIQHHGEAGQTYRFRNLFIKELPVVPADETVSLTIQPPVSVKKINDRVTLIDFGKVAFGNIMLNASQIDSGLATVHFGEKLKNGRVDRKPPGTVRYGVTNIRKNADETGERVVPAPIDSRNTEQAGNTRTHPPAVLTPSDWQPVMPFRWVEIEGWDGEFKPEHISRRAAFATAWNDDASSFECSDPTLNRIWDLCKYSIKATTFAGVYVDGDRERIPYEADAYLNQLSHYYTDDDVQMAATTFDWLMENGTWPTEWAPHMVFMAHAQWMYSGDINWLRHRYESLKTKTLLRRAADDGLVRSNELDRKKHDIVDWPKTERDGYVFTEINTVVNAFHIEALKRMAKMAAAIGKRNEAKTFAARAELATTAFQQQLFDESTGLYRDGVGTDHSSVHANFFPLAFGLVPAEKTSNVVSWLIQQDMKCSVYAAQYLLDSLFDQGSGEKAIELMIADNDRSWKHMVDSGTTITWEAWDLKYKPNQDWNHAWGAAPANLLPRHVLGVQPNEPGWASAKIRPCPGGLKFARGKVPTSRGPIEVNWEIDNSFKLALSLPAGITARLELPATGDGDEITGDGQPVKATRLGNYWHLNDAVTGHMTFKVNARR